MWNINKLKILIALLVAGASILMVPAIASAGPAQVASVDARGAICRGVSSADGGAGSSCPEGGTNIGNVVKTVINILSFVAGIIAVIMLIVGGLKYITSSGDPSSISSAKNTIIYAIVGIVVVVFAQMLVQFVLFRTEG